MKNINWGILAPGKIARKFADDLKQVPGAKIHAVASRSEERAAAFAAQYGATHAYGTYEGLLECPELDVVYIASPHVGHYEHSLMLLNKGIAVLCEKPLAINSNQVKEMIAAARKNNTFFMEAIWTRFIPVIKKTLELIERDMIGEVFSVKADFGFKASFDPSSRLLDNKLGGGSLLDIGIYPAFLALLLLGKPEKIQAHAHIGRTNVDEECAAIFEYANGKMAQIHSSIRSFSKTEAFIYGEQGVIHIHSRWHESKSMTLLLNGERPKDYYFDYSELGYRFEAEETMRCLREGLKESPALPWSFSEDLMAVLDEIRKQTDIHYPEHDS